MPSRDSLIGRAARASLPNFKPTNYNWTPRWLDRALGITRGVGQSLQGPVGFVRRGAGQLGRDLYARSTYGREGSGSFVGPPRDLAGPVVPEFGPPASLGGGGPAVGSVIAPQFGPPSGAGGQWQEGEAGFVGPPRELAGPVPSGGTAGRGGTLRGQASQSGAAFNQSLAAHMAAMNNEGIRRLFREN